MHLMWSIILSLPYHFCWLFYTGYLGEILVRELGMIAFQFKEENKNDTIKMLCRRKWKTLWSHDDHRSPNGRYKQYASTCSFENQLVSYKQRLEDDGTSTPFTLSQMNVDISHVLIDNKLMLSESQSEQIKKLRELSAICYG